MELATLNLDTYKIVKLLQGKGYSEAQAEGFIEAVQDITLSGVATKQDIRDVRDEIQNVRDEIQDLRNELKADINDLRNEVKADIQAVLKFQIIQTVAIIGVMVALLSYFN